MRKAPKEKFVSFDFLPVQAQKATVIAVIDDEQARALGAGAVFGPGPLVDSEDIARRPFVARVADAAGAVAFDDDAKLRRGDTGRVRGVALADLDDPRLQRGKHRTAGPRVAEVDFA